MAESDSHRVTLSADATRTGLEAVQQLSQLGAEENASAFKSLAESIDIHIFDSAFRLTLDPKTVHSLINNGPRVMKGCIRLMEAGTAKDSDIIVHPSFDYSYTCFRLLVATFNLCFLDGCNQLDAALKTYEKFTSYKMHTAVSVILSKEMETQAKILEAGGDCDSVLGWLSSTSSVQQTALITHEDALALLNLLWDFRKNLLQAMLSISPPGLSGLMFLFLRSVIDQPALQARDWKLLQCKLIELAMRYMLIGHPKDHWNQHDAITAILNYIGPLDDVWMLKPRHVDKEDSRRVLQTFIGLLSSHTQKRFPTHTPFILLRLISHCVDFDTQELLPKVMGLSVQYGWLMTIRVRVQVSMIAITWGFFGSLTKMLLLPHKEVTDSTTERIVIALRDADILDLISRTIAELKPAQRVPSPASEQNEEILQIVLRFVANIFRMFTSKGLGSVDMFQDYAQDWLKFYQYLRDQAFGLTQSQIETEAHRHHYKKCINAWLVVSEGLGIDKIIRRDHSVHLCHNLRCPTLFAYNHIRQGCQHGCANCGQRRTYCDSRCQAIDWQVNVEHRELCNDPDDLRYSR